MDTNLQVQVPVVSVRGKILIFLGTCSMLGCAVMSRWSITDKGRGQFVDPSTLRVLNVSSEESAPAWSKEELIDTSTMDRETARVFLDKLAQEGRLYSRRVASFPVPDEWLTPLDEEILADGPVKDLTTIASPNNSILQLVHPRPGQMVRVGDKVTVHVVLRDTRNRPVLKGGDEVRVWMVGKGAGGQAAAVDVTDLHNGTYVTSFPILWSGVTEIRAALERPREFRRLILSLMASLKMLRHIISAFVSKEKEQVTLCSFIPVIPGYPDVCNLTSLNTGLPWYCGRPTKMGLECHHWAWTANIDLQRRFPVSDTENIVLDRFFNMNETQGRLMPSISLNILGHNTQLLSAKPCEPLQPRDTWTDQSPRGYWENHIWHPLKGCPLPELNKHTLSQCLRGTKVTMIGDSNAVQIVNLLGALLGCSKLPDPLRARHPNMLHVPIVYDCRRDKTQVAWYPHANPMYTGTKWTDSRVKYAPSAIIDKLPSSGKHIILVHLFAHFSRLHTNLLALHIRDTARALRDLLNRNPDVKVFIRGQHAINRSMYCLTCDLIVERGLRMLQYEFREISDRVVLLNTWDMTVAIENAEIHPGKSVVTALGKMIIAHACPK